MQINDECAFSAPNSWALNASINLGLSTPWTTLADDKLLCLLLCFFFQKIEFCLSCKLSPFPRK